MLSALSAIIFLAFLSLRIFGIGTVSTPTPVLLTSQKDKFPSEFVYPNSQKIDVSTYSTADSPEKTIDWYKNKLNEYKPGTKSIISTASNGNNITLIETRGKDIKIHIQITRKSTDSTTQIKFLQ